jgi:hypothetical protein
MATKASLKQPNAHGFAGITRRRNTGKTEGKAAFFLLAATRVVPIQAMCERSGQS